MKPEDGFQGLEKRITSLSYHMTPNQPNKDKNLIQERNSHVTSLNLCISSTLVAILMTSSFRPDTELRWVNWLKVLHMPQSLF